MDTLSAEKRGMALLGSGAVVSTILTFLGFAFFLYILLLLASGIHLGHEDSITLDLTFWVLLPAFFLSFCASLLLAIDLSRMRSRMKKADFSSKNASGKSVPFTVSCEPTES